MGMEAAIALAAVSTAAGAYSSIQQGQAQSAALKAQAEAQRRQEEAQRTAALQREAQRREELLSQQSTVDALRAGRGLSGDSPTALRIRQDVTGDAMDAMRVERLNILNGADSSRMSAEQSDAAASTALTTGYLRAGTSLLDFGAKAFAPTSLANSDPGFQGTWKGRAVSYFPNSGSKF
ncbi:multidrug resistance efflux pump [Azospirillum fermentarium]|uniref:hypothetical protein n=1 Tax=Azospirillum fermentarium TaxID=1233114 RepID=UPI002226127B|nr:hypothetical protein [Azospirillum fermentarium]MCW2244752.1 multidrug resistance efflux pump [Azospirillum fermentarium]